MNNSAVACLSFGKLMQDDEYQYKALKYIEQNPDISQRKLAQQLNLSLGKVNYIVAALVEKGLIKLDRFARSENKAGYIYSLTPKALRHRAVLAKTFLERKQEEYKHLKKEIEILKREVR